MLVPIGSNNSVVCRRESVVNLRGMKEILTEEASPEKAGVGGSIPSLATTLTLTLLESAFRRPFFCLCKICAVDFFRIRSSYKP
jgi:hypothetical protein